MKRQQYRVMLTHPEGVMRDTKYAMNSGIARSEGLVREYGRSKGFMLYCDKAKRVGDTYTRRWRATDGTVVMAIVGPDTQPEI